MLKLNKITKYFDEKIILDEVSMIVNDGQAVALIGPNGVGKTTLLKIIVGEMNYDFGEIKNTLSVGYVPQKIDDEEIIIKEYFDDAKLWKINYALSLVDLSYIDIDKDIKTLSGGEKTRLSIAKVFSKNDSPELLILDEPTNNLDTEMIAWLKKFINKFSGSVLIASHDRSFINEVANSIYELKDCKLKHYAGNFEFYKQERQNELDRHYEDYEKYNETKNKLNKHIAEFRERSRRVSNTSFDKIKHESKMAFQGSKSSTQAKAGSKIKALKSKLGQLEEIKKPKLDKLYKINIDGEVHKNKIIFSAENINKSYRDISVLRQIELEIIGKDRVQVTGKNGSGKSTLLKIVSHKINADSGEIKWSEGIRIGYYSQDTEMIDMNASAYENLKNPDVDDERIYYQARKLGLVFKLLPKKTKTLSRGQQAKLAFCKLLLQNNDLLILDEPTNHMDIETKELLESALREYEGAILVASHDKYFIEQIEINKVLDL
jgi:ATPase subunit of ABC transporter with duplicated ATPase domains